MLSRRGFDFNSKTLSHLMIACKLVLILLFHVSSFIFVISSVQVIAMKHQKLVGTRFAAEAPA